MSCVMMLGMTAHIYNLAATAASTIWMNPLAFVGLAAVALVIVTGLAGRLVILYEDLRFTRFVGRHQ